MMTGFLDLPRSVRDKIYRLHLVQDEKMTGKRHRELIEDPLSWNSKSMPPICLISQQIEKEAAPIYYGENHFEFRAHDPGSGYVQSLTNTASHRHLQMVRKVTFDWPKTDAHWDFLQLAKMKNIQELYIGVDELEMVRSLRKPRYHQRRRVASGPTPQEQLIILQHPGMQAFIALKGVQRVEFVKRRASNGQDVGGPIAGGVLETQVAPKLTKPKKLKGIKKAKVRKNSISLFLELPPEIRNRIYGILLHIDGPIHASKAPPSSVPKREIGKTQAPESALSVLAVNRQIHREAVGIFYHNNEFQFYYPSQLHVFLLSLGPQRQSFISNLTLGYFNTKSGGVDIIDMTFPMLKNLTSLRRLHIILDDDLSKRLGRDYLLVSRWSLDRANPMQLAGMRFLFTLRGITDIRVRDRELEDRVDKLKPDASYPKGCKAYLNLKLEQILEFFNAALADAQKGIMNDHLFEDEEWHMKDPFPTMDEIMEDVADESEEDSDDESDDGSLYEP